MADCFEESKRENAELTKDINEKNYLVDSFREQVGKLKNLL